MSKTRMLVILITILSGIDIGLLWIGGPTTAAHTAVVDVVQFEQTVSLDPANPPVIQPNLVEIRPARAIVDGLTAAGAIELISKQQVVLAVDGIVSQVAVKVGDTVATGDLLLTLDPADLQRALSRAELDLETAQADLDKLYEGSSPSEIAAAEAHLLAAQQNLARVQAGATADELAAAQSKLAAARAKYNELQAPPSGAEIDEVNAELEKAEIDRRNAQREYDKVKWANNIGMLPEAAALHKATVEYERVQAKFNRINQGSSQSSIQEAASAIQKAASELEQLRQKPNAADLAEAHAKVADAEQRLAKLQTGPSGAQLEAAEAKVKRAQLDIEEARSRLQHTAIRAPIDGTVLELSIAAGERGTVGKVVATLADTRQLKLNVKVAEVDIPNITVGQEAQIAIDAIRGHTYSGIVESIAPINQADRDVVSYPVTIRLTDADLEGVRPGMNAVATLNNATAVEERWLVPTNALRPHENGQTFVMVQRGEVFAPVAVVRGEAQGEWTLVQAPELRPGDQVLGSVASYVDQQLENDAGGS
jgi:HlyD family secretion protein